MIRLLVPALLLAHLPAFVAKDEGTVEWHLAPTNAVECDFGTNPPQDQCQAAVAELATVAQGSPPRRGLQNGHGGHCADRGWGGVPLGCTAQANGDWAAHYKTSGPNCNNGGYRLVCSGATVIGPLGDQQPPPLGPSTVTTNCTTGLCTADSEWMLFYSGKTEMQCKAICQDGRRIKPVAPAISERTFYGKTEEDDKFHSVQVSHQLAGAWTESGPCQAFAHSGNKCLIYTSCSQVNSLDFELPADLAYLGKPSDYKTCIMDQYDTVIAL